MYNNFLVLAATLLTLAACSTTPPTLQTGPDAEITHDGLTRVDNSALDVAWVRAGTDLSGYSKILFKGVGIEYRPAKGPYSGRAGSTATVASSRSETEFQLDDATKGAVGEEIQAAFLEELAKSQRFQIVDQPGEDVLTLNAGLLDVVSRVPPDNLGRGAVYLDRVGEATLVMELRDSMSNAIFARAIDRRAAERSAGMMMESNTVTNRAEVRRLGRRWASLVRSGLETLLSKDS
jgi:hypothetical protein